MRRIALVLAIFLAGFAGVIERSHPVDPDTLLFSNCLSHYLMGAVFDARRKIEKAAAEYKKALHYRDDIPQVHTRLGADLLLLKRFDEAAAEAEKAIVLDPEGVKGRILLALISVAKKDYARFDRIFEEVTAIKPNDIGVMYFFADLFALRGKYDKAAELYEKMLSEDAGNPFLHFNLGILYRKAKKPEKAEQSLKKAIEIDKDYFEAQMVLGLVYESEKNFDEAIKQYEVVLLARPLDAEPYLRIFNIHIIRKEYKKAESVLNEALAKEAPEIGGVYASMGYLAMLRNDAAGAVENYGLAMKEEPGNVFYKFLLASAFEKKGDRRMAARLLEECLAEEENFPEANNFLGYLYAVEGKELEKAVTLIKKALEADPENGAYLDSLGWAYYRQGKYREALECMEKASRILPDDPVVLGHLGDVYFALGEKEKAAENWQKALDVAPDDGRLKEKLRKVK